MSVMERKPVGRLAMRVEGTLWVAYYALQETMKGAIFLGSISMVAVRDNPERKQAFMDLMRGFVGDILEEKFGNAPIWSGPEPAPESERGGRA